MPAAFQTRARMESATRRTRFTSVRRGDASRAAYVLRCAALWARDRRRATAGELPRRLRNHRHRRPLSIRVVSSAGEGATHAVPGVGARVFAAGGPEHRTEIRFADCGDQVNGPDRSHGSGWWGERWAR